MVFAVGEAQGLLAVGGLEVAQSGVGAVECCLLSSEEVWHDEGLLGIGG